MASAFAHAVAATTIGTLVGIPWRLWGVFVLGMVCAVLPDLDSIGFWLGVPYEHPLGHRGLSHSIAFAGVTSWSLVRLSFRRRPRDERRRVGWFLFLATASHGTLDAMTNGGLGVAFFAPFDNARYFFPFRPIEVSPLEPERFFTQQGVEVLATELVWVGIPSLAAMLGASAWRRQCGRIAQLSGTVGEAAVVPVTETTDPAAEPGTRRGD